MISCNQIIQHYAGYNSKGGEDKLLQVEGSLSKVSI